ncbi:chemotaxis protein CheW [Desulfurispira natronophila]|uniref:Purine-binding chemotaxis protein CheW n=1 Tax=Desulfurispira natronophila TaxID=682562 RepID=A0A7W8DGU5_9BACT|nr:chemotaxis protein CheW [Desulfurispira natronophila]MBB5021795.1 purine-binding chemotaxis protein CheW [Desulfurispira natronophila]
MNSTLKKQQGERAQRYLLFELQDEAFAFNISGVREIIAYMKPTPIPGAPESIQGILDLRGKIIPIIDLRCKFGMAPQGVQMDTAIIILQHNNQETGFVVDRVSEVVGLSSEVLSDPPRLGHTVSTEYMAAVARFRDQVIVVLKTDQVCDFEADSIAQHIPERSVDKNEVLS